MSCRTNGIANLLALAACLSPPAAAQSIVEHVTDAGLRVWDFPDDDADRFSIALLVGVGARDERPEQAGIAHFLEHSLFLSTDERPATSRDGDLLRRGVDHNGYTSSEVTVYYLTGRASQWRFMVEWLADHVLHPKFDPAEVEAEQRIVLEEIVTRGPDFAAITVENLLYGDHPLARSIGGSTRTVGGVGVDELRAFYERHYHAGNMVVGFSGRVATEECMQAVQQAFAAAPPQPRGDGADELGVGAPTARTGDLLGAASPELTGDLRLGYHLRCTTPEQLGVLMVIERHLARRFFDVAREQRQLAYAPSVDLTWGRDVQRLVFECPTSDRRNVRELAAIATELVAELQALDADDVHDAASSASAGLRCDSVRDLTRAMEQMAWVASHDGQVGGFDEHVALVTAADVAAVARDVLRADRRYSLSNVTLLDDGVGLRVLLFVGLIGLAVLVVRQREALSEAFGRLRGGLRRPRKGRILAMPSRAPIKADDVDVDEVERGIQQFFEDEDRAADDR